MIPRHKPMFVFILNTTTPNICKTSYGGVRGTFILSVGSGVLLFGVKTPITDAEAVIKYKT
jgi:hypothetical protein